jgi:hypothetical protein
MALIDEINKSISQMSEVELLDRIKELRSARRVYTPIANRKPKAKSGGASLQALLGALSPDELQSLLANLEDEE